VITGCHHFNASADVGCNSTCESEGYERVLSKSNDLKTCILRWVKCDQPKRCVSDDPVRFQTWTASDLFQVPMGKTAKIVTEVMRSIGCGYLIVVTLIAVLCHFITRYIQKYIHLVPDFLKSFCRERTLHRKLHTLQDLSMLAAHIIIRLYRDNVEMSV